MMKLYKFLDFKKFGRVRKGEATPEEAKEVIRSFVPTFGLLALLGFLFLMSLLKTASLGAVRITGRGLENIVYTCLLLSGLAFAFGFYIDKKFLNKDGITALQEKMRLTAEKTRFEFRRRAILEQMNKPPYVLVFTYVLILFSMGDAIALYGVLLITIGASISLVLLFFSLSVLYFMIFNRHVDRYCKLVDELEYEKPEEPLPTQKAFWKLGKTGIVGIALILFSASSGAVWYFFFNYELPNQIFIISVGPYVEGDLEELCTSIEDELGIRCDFVGWIEIPERAFDSKRKQFRADVLLEEVKKFNIVESTKVLGVTYGDLYYPGLNFVFGVAEKRGGTAVMSLIRLNPESYGQPQNNSLYMERATKVALKMLGHTFGFRTSRSRGCVMAYSNSLQELDAKSKEFCGKNKRIIDEWRRKFEG